MESYLLKFIYKYRKYWKLRGARRKVSASSLSVFGHPVWWDCIVSRATVVLDDERETDKSVMYNWEEANCYQLHILVDRDVSIAVGNLGVIRFPGGLYIYTGSAKRNIGARVMRHLAQAKKMRWHIDYLLHHETTRITCVELFSDSECELNKKVDGVVLVSRFGATDCQANCGSHLKYLGKINGKWAE